MEYLIFAVRGPPEKSGLHTSSQSAYGVKGVSMHTDWVFEVEGSLLQTSICNLTISVRILLNGGIRCVKLYKT